MTRALDEYNERRRHDAQRRKVRKRSGYSTEARRRKIVGATCRLCPEPYAEYHHIVPRAQMPGSGLVSDPDNAMPLCHEHHQAHHTTVAGRVPRSALLPAEEAFALRIMGAGWVDRWYPA